MNNFTVYSREGCPYCEKIKEVMQLAKLQHRVYAVSYTHLTLPTKA